MHHLYLSLRGIVLTGLMCVVVSKSAFADLDHVLFQAIRRGDTELLATLLRQGTPVNLRTADGTTPLMYAAVRGSADSVKLLLEHGADPNAANDAKVTALLWSAGDLHKVRLLVNRGANLNVRSELGNTPLIVAAAHADSTAVVEFMLSHGADLKAKNKRGYTALHSAVGAGNPKTVKLLAAKGAKVDADDDTSRSDLAIAADRGSMELVEFLLEHGADPNAGNSRRHSLNAALLAQKPEIARLLIKHNARFDRQLSPGKVPSILLAAYNEVGDTSIVQLMIDKGVDLDAANQYDETALTWARKRGSQRLIDLLVNAGAAEGKLHSKQSPSRNIELTDENTTRLIGGAIRKSIELLQHSSDVFLEKRENCISCHHQNMPAVAIGWARDRGFEVDEESIGRMIERQHRSWAPRIGRAYEVDRPVPVAPRFIGYGLIGFSALSYTRDDVTDAMVWYLAAIQQPDGYWIPGMLRPPQGGAEIVATVLAMRSLQLYPLEGRDDVFAARVARARQWLHAAEPRTHQERVFKLLGLGWAGSSSESLAGNVAELLEEQRDDGGWAQLPDLNSDAWATGQTLVALRTAGALPTSSAAYRRGIEFLLRTQFDDGSWYVRSRTWPFQTHFDSEFPHGKDQWISAPATAWAVMALTLAVDPSPNVVVSHQERSPLATSPTPSIASNKNPKTAAPATNESVVFSKHIQPIFERSCIGCHSGAVAKGGFRVTTRNLLIKGGESGEAAIAVDRADDSPLLRFVSDQVEDLEMPPLAQRNKYPPLTKQQISQLRTWIQQGAPWPSAVVLKPSE
jgi:ankyrin repeat protein/mono/diheme cytochrome c family protein